MKLPSFSYIPAFVTLCLVAPLSTAADEPRHDQAVIDPPYGLALFQYFQQKPLAAITEIDVGKFRQRLDTQSDDAELLLGNLYYGYDLPDDAELIFKHLLDAETPQSTQDRVWFNLARMQFRQDDPAKTTELLARIQQPLPTQHEQQRHYLSSNLLLRQQQFEQAAEASKQISNNSVWRAYAEYNLHLAQLSSDSSVLAEQGLDNMQRFASAELGAETRGLADSALLAKALHQMREERLDEALSSLSRISLDGPASNKALLAAGWILSRQKETDKAVAYWQALQQKQQFDRASLESLIAVPYTWEQGDNPRLAISYYQIAVDRYQQVLLQLLDVRAQVEQNRLIDALLQQRIIETQQIQSLEQNGIPPITADLLYSLIAEERFQREVRHYQELLEIVSALQRWRDTIPVYQLMLRERRKYFEQKRPLLAQSDHQQQLGELLGQRDRLASRINTIEREQDFLALASEEENDYLTQLGEVESLLLSLHGQQDLSEARDKHHLLLGLLQYQIETDYPRRIWGAKRELQLLDRSLDEATRLSTSLEGAAQQNDSRLDELAQRIDGQTAIIEPQLQRSLQLLERQRQHINQIAIEEIDAHLRQVEEFHLNAQYSLARLYDQMSQRGDSQ